jgi:hypothetical protein
MLILLRSIIFLTGKFNADYWQILEAVFHYKRICGNTIKARKLPQQKAEAWARAVALNRMTGLGMPVSVKI